MHSVRADRVLRINNDDKSRTNVWPPLEALRSMACKSEIDPIRRPYADLQLSPFIRNHARTYPLNSGRQALS